MKFWIARDWDGLTLFQSESEPQLTDDYLWYDNGDGDFMRLSEDLFPEITFENSPMQVELKLIKEE